MNSERSESKSILDFIFTIFSTTNDSFENTLYLYHNHQCGVDQRRDRQFFCYEANTIDTPVTCFAKSNACRIYTDSGQALIVIIVPVMVMVDFGCGTIRNIQQRRKLTFTGTDETISVPRNRRSLTRMLITQVVVWPLFTLKLMLITIYFSSTLN